VHSIGRKAKEKEGKSEQEAVAAGSQKTVLWSVSFIRQAHRFFTVDRISHQHKTKPQQSQKF
jgi:hypothetical protein